MSGSCQDAKARPARPVRSPGSSINGNGLLRTSPLVLELRLHTSAVFDGLMSFALWQFMTYAEQTYWQFETLLLDGMEPRRVIILFRLRRPS